MANYDRRDIVGVAVATTLASSIISSDTTITITSATGWPSGSNGPFFIQIDDEIILCSSRSSTTLTTAGGASGRGKDGTTAASHSSGTEVLHIVTKTDADEANYTVAETVGKVTAAGQLLIGDGANSLAALDVKTSGRIIVGNGTTAASVAVSGDVTLDSAGAATIANDAVTYAKLQNVSATDRLLGRDTAAAGNAEELTVGGGVEFTGSGGIQRSALSGDVSATAGSGTTAIGTAKVLTAMIADAAVTADKVAAAVAGAGLAGGAGTALSVNVDTTTIEISTDTLQVKSGGLTPTYIARQGVRLRRAANQSISNNTLTAISWDTEDQDTSAFITTTSSTLTIPANLGGVYAITLRFDQGADAYPDVLRIAAGGRNYDQDFTVSQISTTLHVTVALGVADTVVCSIRHQQGTSKNFQGSLDLFRLTA